MGNSFIEDLTISCLVAKPNLIPLIVPGNISNDVPSSISIHQRREGSEQVREMERAVQNQKWRNRGAERRGEKCV
nr:hypothetical protein Iba_chr12dCG0850 [Ipomoea batatas]